MDRLLPTSRKDVGAKPAVTVPPVALYAPGGRPLIVVPVESVSPPPSKVGKASVLVLGKFKAERGKVVGNRLFAGEARHNH